MISSSWWSRSSAALLLVGFAVGLTSVAAGADQTAAATSTLPAVKHVFVIVLENKGYDETFTADSKAPYLSRELPKLGQVLTNFYGTGHFSLTNYVAMVSGQAPTPETNGDCLASYKDVTPGTPAADGQVVGTGCIYPAAVKTIADQLTTKGLTWKGYFGDMGTPCRHPDANAPDPTLKVKPGDQYAARHNPFIYFHSVLDTSACKNNDVDLSQLSTDLASAATTPNYVFISPNVCDDGHDGPCVDGAPGGLESADAFLKSWVPKILASPAYKDGGLLAVTFDEAEGSDATACCNEQSGPNVPKPGLNGPGGGRIGTVLISPFVPAGTVNDTAVNHYSMLRGVEDLFGLDHLGYAGRADLPVIDSVFDMSRAPSQLFAIPPPTTAPPATSTTTAPATRRPAPGAASPQLANTGRNLLPLIVLGLGSLLTGVALLGASRRRRYGR